MAVCCLPFISSGCKQSETAVKESSISDALYQNLPFEMPKVQQPVFPAYEVNIEKFGAKGDGLFLNTKAINDAIKEVNQRGGGKVIIPEGVWLTGPIELLSNVNLYTEQNALVLFTGDFEAYPIIATSFEGLETRRCQSPISARNAENIAITGHGTFDGNGDCWRPVKKGKLTASQWKKLVNSGGVLDEKQEIWYPTAGSLKGAMACKDFNVPEGINTDEEWAEIRPWLRPVLLSIVKSKKVLLEGVTFKNSPSWCLHPLSCEDFTVNNIMVINPWYSQNGDAIDLESCKNALIINSVFDAGDDAICIKSGKDEDGRRRGEPCQNVIVKNNTVLHGHGGFVVGSEMSGGVKNIYVEDCTFMGTDVGLRFKSTRGRGGVVENIYINNISLFQNLLFIRDSMAYHFIYRSTHALWKSLIIKRCWNSSHCRCLFIYHLVNFFCCHPGFNMFTYIIKNRYVDFGTFTHFFKLIFIFNDASRWNFVEFFPECLYFSVEVSMTLSIIFSTSTPTRLISS